MDELVWPTPTRRRIVVGVFAVLLGLMCPVGPVLAGASDAGLGGYPVLLAALGVVLVVGLVLLVVRALGPSAHALSVAGVERRSRKVRVTPWAEVAGMWITRNGRIGILHVAPRTGDRYWVPVPETVGDDEVRAAVRRLSGDTVEVTDGPPVEPRAVAAVHRREFRAPGRLFVVPVALAVLFVVLAALLVVTRWLYLLAPTAPVLIWTAVAFWRVSGRSAMDDKGFTVDGRTIAWSAISSVHEERIGRWRTVRVIPSGGRQGTALRGLIDQPPGNPGYRPALEAVRAACAGRVAFTQARVNALMFGTLVTVILFMPVALVAVPFVLSRPWDQHWWPGVAIATATPDPCAVLRSEAARRLVPDGSTPRPSVVYSGQRQECTLEAENARLTLHVERSEPGYSRSATAEAREDYDIACAVIDDDVPLAGVGDEAVIAVARQVTVDIATRRANVVFRLGYAGRRTDSDAVRADAVDLVRAAAASVRLR